MPRFCCWQVVGGMVSLVDLLVVLILGLFLILVHCSYCSLFVCCWRFVAVCCSLPSLVLPCATENRFAVIHKKQDLSSARQPFMMCRYWILNVSESFHIIPSRVCSRAFRPQSPLEPQKLRNRRHLNFYQTVRAYATSLCKWLKDHFTSFP